MPFKTKKKAPTLKQIEEQMDEPDEEEEEVEEEEEPEEEIEEDPKVKVKKADDKVWSIQEVPTATTQVIFNSKTKTAYDLTSAIVELLNRTEG